MTSKLLSALSEELKSSLGSLAESYARRALCLTLDVSLTQLYSLPSDFELTDLQLSKLNNLVASLKLGKPITQFEGKTEFCGYEIKVCEDVLIPRLETEYLTELFIVEVKRAQLPQVSILEVGTGSGCITTAVVGELIKSNHSFIYVASEISQAALNCTVQNLTTFNPKITKNDDFIELVYDNGKVIIYSSRVIKIPEIHFQYLVSNPPYLSELEYLDLDNSVKNYEPKVALTDGLDGLEVYREIYSYLSKSPSTLPQLFLELSPTIAGKVQELFSTLYREANLQLAEDQFDRVRFLISKPT